MDYYLPIDEPSATSGAAKFINRELRGKTYQNNHGKYQTFVRIYGTHCKTLGYSSNIFSNVGKLHFSLLQPCIVVIWAA